MQPAYRHGGLIVWTGGGYSFHSTLAPKGWKSLPGRGDEPFHAEAKPAGSAELRLVDAMALIEALTPLVSAAGFAHVPAPQVKREQEKRQGEVYDDEERDDEDE